MKKAEQEARAAQKKEAETVMPEVLQVEVAAAEEMVEKKAIKDSERTVE